MPVGGISPDRMDPWLSYYGEQLNPLSSVPFSTLYAAHSGPKVDLETPVFSVGATMGTVAYKTLEATSPVQGVVAAVTPEVLLPP